MYHRRVWQSYFPTIQTSYMRAMQEHDVPVAPAPTERSVGAREALDDVSEPDGIDQRFTHQEEEVAYGHQPKAI